MSLNLEELMAIYSQQAWIEILPEAQEKAWQITQKMSSSASHWNAYLNQLGLQYFVNWVQEDATLQENLKVLPSEADLASIWEFVNGTRLMLGETRFVLIPTDKNGFSEIRIPQEWIDIPNWVADYYVGIELNLDERWLRVYGYTTYEQIEKLGTYDRLDRTYSLDTENLEEDLNVMWVERELFGAKKIEVQALPIREVSPTENLLEQLSDRTYGSPRLELTFEEWAAIIANDEMRQQLYQKRLLNSTNEPKPIQNNVLEDPNNQFPTNDLSLWLQNIFGLGWQSLETLLGSDRKTIAFQFRTDSLLNEVRVKSAKLIDLGIDLKGMTLMLLIGLTVEVDRRVGIRVQLYPATGETYLPAGIELSLLSEKGEILQEVQSRSYDNYIQLKRFKSPSGKRFAIQVALGNIRIKEDFIFLEERLANQYE